MKKTLVKVGAVLAAVLFLSITVMEPSAQARAGGSRSMGSSGSRSYSRPAGPASQSGQYRQQAPAASSPFQQQGGGFLRNMAGGVMGGMLGSMLFSSVAGAGGAMGGGRGGGIGLVEILLLAGIGYLIYRYIKNKRADQSSNAPSFRSFEGGTVIPISNAPQNSEQESHDLAAGLAQIRQMDLSFDEKRFKDLAMDTFFNIQGAWMNRDLSPVAASLTDEMKRIFQSDLDQLLRDKQMNRLENIAVRNVELTEAWQEVGQDYITTLIYANLLDYTTEEATGAVVVGSKTEPIKFEEFWTFTRPVGNSSWRLSAIGQK
jgi:predicted lipid-binding transport protein (Tim44 family)